MTQIECCRISSTVCAGKQTAAVFKMSYLFVCMKLESLPPPVLHCTVTGVQSSAVLHNLFTCSSFQYYFLLSACSFHVGIRTEFCLNFLCKRRYYMPLPSKSVSVNLLNSLCGENKSWYVCYVFFSVGLLFPSV